MNPLLFSNRIAGLFCLAGLAVACGCGKPSGHAPPKPPRLSRCTPGTPGGRLVLATDGIPKSFNPLLAGDAASESVTRFLFSSLVRFDMSAQEPEPDLAESWSVSADQKTWTFKLRQGLRWSDGQPLTADDVLFTWNDLIRNPQFNRFTKDLLGANGKGWTMTKLDDLNVRVVTPEVFAPFLQILSGVPVLPKHALARALRENHFESAYGIDANPSTVVGSGPFRLLDARAGKVILLERNPEYDAVDTTGVRLPYLDEIQLNVAADAAKAAAYFILNQNNVCESVRPEQRPDFEPAFAKNGGRFVELGAAGECNFFWLNQNTNYDAAGRPLVDPTKLQWFRDKKFRQAISCAIDRDRMVREIYGGRGESVLSFVTADNPKWNNPNVAHFGYDPAQARALLEEIGIQDRKGDGVLRDAGGHPIEFTILSNADNAARSKMAAMIRADLRRLGIKVEIQPMTFQAVVEKLTTAFDYESAIVGLGGGGADPATQINVLLSSEPLHQWFPEQKSPSTDWEARMDALMETQLHTLDFAVRKKCYDEVQAIWAEEQPMIPLIAPLLSAAVRSDLANIRPAAASSHHTTWNAEEIYLLKK